MIVTLNWLLLIFLVIFSVNAAGGSAKRTRNSQSPTKNQKLHAPPQMLHLDPNQPLMTQLIQEDFLVTPEDFSKDPDVTYVLNQLHRHQTLEKFYRTAQTVYNDLESFYGELEGDHEIATKFHEFMKKMTAASLSKPLSVTNLILGITRHFRPLFKTKSLPIEELALLMAQLEKDPNRKMIRLMTRFFEIYTIREMEQLQNLINLTSYAGVDPFTARNEELLKRTEAQAQAATTTSKMKSKQRKSSKKGKTTDEDPASNTSNINENFFETFLKSYSERFRITVANAVTKMLILLDLFVNDPSMAGRSVQLYMKLWLVHAKRLAAREKVDVDDLDVRWINPSLYRKFPISFLYDDWKPDILTPEAMEELRQAAEDEARSDKEVLAQRLAKVSKAKFYSNLTWIGGILITVATIISFIIFVLFKYRKSIQKGEDKNIERSEPAIQEEEEEKVSEIVNNLELRIKE